MTEVKIDVDLAALAAEAMTKIEHKQVMRMVRDALRAQVQQEAARIIASDVELTAKIKMAAHAAVDRLFKGDKDSVLVYEVARTIADRLGHECDPY